MSRTSLDESEFRGIPWGGIAKNSNLMKYSKTNRYVVHNELFLN